MLQRATTVGFVLSGFGLSAFFFSALAHMLYPGNTSSFLLFLSLATSLPVIIGFLTIRPVPHSEYPHADQRGPGLHSGEGALGSTSHLLNHGGIETITEGRGLGRAVSGAPRDDDGPDVNEESHNARVTEVYTGVLPAVTVSQSRSNSLEISPSRSESGRRASSRRSVSRTMSLAPPEPESVDMHGKRMLTGWEFWLLFTILSLSEHCLLIAHKIFLHARASEWNGLDV